MPGENIYDWSVTAAINATADTLINWAEGQPRASVNNSARSMMAAHAKQRNLTNGSIVTGGTANAQTFTSGVGYTVVPTGLRVLLNVGAGLTNTAAMTLNMDGIGAVAVVENGGGTALANSFVEFRLVELQYNGGSWVLLDADRVNVAGDTMTGNLTISTISPLLVLNKSASGASSAIAGATAGLGRWILHLGSTAAETGSNAGSDAALQGYNDAGTILISTPFACRRSDGAILLGNSAASSGGYEVGSDVTMRCSTTQWAMQFRGLSDGNNTGLNFNSATVATVGNIYFNAVGTAYATLSDARAKTDDAPFTRGRETLDRLPVKQFKWKVNGADGIGLFAQDVRGIVPLAVPDTADENTPLGIDYSKFVPVLIAALQDAFKAIDQLKTEVAVLKA